MTKPKAKQPLDSFDPRMLQLLLAGARRQIIIPFPGSTGRGRATTFRRRLHTLRARMRQEDHEHWRLASRCYIRLLWGSKALEEGLVKGPLRDEWQFDTHAKLGAFLVIQPADSEFDEVLSSLDLGEPTPTPVITVPDSVKETELETWLQTLATPEVKK